jgi:acylphosphatase
MRGILGVDMAVVARRALLSGRVQGVAFRHYTKVRARELGLVGWVRNLADGRVETWVEGPEEAVQTMIAWLQHGPPSARVEDLSVETVDVAKHERFGVR